MKKCKISEIPNSISLFVVRNASTKDILFQILLECKRKFHSLGENSDEIEWELEDIEVECNFDVIPLMKYHNSLRNDILMNNVDEFQFYDFIGKFEHIRPWLKCVYEPKWKKSLGDEFYDYVRDYIKNDLYIFCCAFPGLESYIDNIDSKLFIKDRNKSND